MSTDPNRYSVILDDELLEKLKARAKEERCSRADIVRRALEVYLDGENGSAQVSDLLTIKQLNVIVVDPEGNLADIIAKLTEREER